MVNATPSSLLGPSALTVMLPQALTVAFRFLFDSAFIGYLNSHSAYWKVWDDSRIGYGLVIYIM